MKAVVDLQRLWPRSREIEMKIICDKNYETIISHTNFASIIGKNNFDFMLDMAEGSLLS